MEKQKKILYSGLFLLIFILLLMPLFSDKAFSTIVILLLLGIVVSKFLKVLHSKGLTIKDLDIYIDNKISMYKEENNYRGVILYKAIRPLVMIGMAIIGLLILSLLVV